MFKIAPIIFLILLINENIGYLVKVNRKYFKSDVDKVIAKYIDPIKKIKAVFPNHEVELQLEIQETITYPSAVHFRHPSIHRRVMPAQRRVGASSVTIMPKTTPRTTTTTPTTPVATITTTTPMTSKTTTTPVTLKKPDLDPAKKPVLMGDLMKVLDEFAAKHLKNIKDPDKTPVKQQETSKTHGEELHVDDILKLIKRGVQIKSHAPKPNEDGLDWLQIKIPKAL